VAEASHSGQTIAAFAARAKSSEAAGHALGDGGSNGGSGGGGSFSLLPFSIKDYFDAREQATEFRFSERLDGLPTRETVWNVSVMVPGGIITALTLFMGVLAFGGDRFDGGLNLPPSMHEARLEQHDIDAAQDARLNRIEGRLDRIEAKLDLLLEQRSADGG